MEASNLVDQLVAGTVSSRTANAVRQLNSLPNRLFLNSFSEYLSRVARLLRIIQELDKVNAPALDIFLVECMRHFENRTGIPNINIYSNCLDVLHEVSAFLAGGRKVISFSTEWRDGYEKLTLNCQQLDEFKQRLMDSFPVEYDIVTALISVGSHMWYVPENTLEVYSYLAEIFEQTANKINS